MNVTLAAVGLALALLVGLTARASAQLCDCRWIGQGEALYCSNTGAGWPTLSTWQGSGWTTVPAGAGFTLPALAGGFSTYGRSCPPSPVTPAAGYHARSWLGPWQNETTVVYGPGATSHALNCTTWYSGYAGSTVYQTCR